MNNWFDFLASQPTQALDPHNSLCALQQSAILYVGGDDAEEFLQNQLSNDIQQIDETCCQFSSCSSAKGRMFGIFRVVKIEGGYLLLMPRSIVLDVQQRLQKFVLRARVVLADISDSFAQLAIAGSDDSLPADDCFPKQVHQVYQSDSLITIRLHAQANSARYLLFTNDPNEAIDLWRRFSEELTVNDDSSWRYQEIANGIPALHPATQDAFVLQMCNLDALEGVSFKKGCYPGQEVVARTHYLGKLKRRMFMAEVDGDSCPAPGDELTTRGSDKADGSGKVVDAIPTPQGPCWMLFVARIDKATAGELVLAASPVETITLKPLPYPLPE